MEKMIGVSVIIPCYNSAHFMDKCFKSLERQTFRNFEVVVVDDGSTDNSFILLEKEREKRNFRMTLLKLPTNQGPGIARNMGIANAKGKYIAFCDSDDYYSMNYLEEMFNVVNSENADLGMCDVIMEFANGKRIKKNSISKMGQIPSKEDYIALSEASLCCLLVKRDLFDYVKLPALYNGEDMAVVPIILLHANKIVHVKESYYYYCIRENSASNKVSAKVYRDMLEVFDRLEEQWLDRYKEAFEFLSIKTMLYSAILVGLKAGVSMSELKQKIMEFEQKFPNWRKNRYIKSLGINHRIFLFSIHLKTLGINYIYILVHRFIIDKGGIIK